MYRITNSTPAVAVRRQHNALFPPVKIRFRKREFC
jgi:hypothetical protein